MADDPTICLPYRTLARRAAPDYRADPRIGNFRSGRRRPNAARLEVDRTLPPRFV